MYNPPHFEEVRESEILKIIKHFPLATIVCNKDGEFIANHIPLLRISQNSYLGHIAKANPVHTIFPNGTDAIAIFSAQDSYIYRQIGIQQKHRHIVKFQLGIIKLCI